MAVDKKISQLTSLAQVDVVTTTDVLPIVDTSLTETKKITVGALVGAGAAAGLTGVDINSGSIDGTAIGASSASTGAFTTLSASGAVTLNPANAAVSLAPTGTGTVTINPATAGTLNNVAIGGSTAAAGTFTSATVSTGNLTFSSTGQRITGDMSNATHANRLSFQTSVTNGATSPFIIPNGTGNTTSIVVANASDPTNCSFGQLTAAGSSEIRLLSGILGTGTYLPMAFYTGGSERMRLDTSGNLGIGVTPSANTTSKLFNVGDFTRVGASGGYLFNLYYSITNARWEYAGTGTGAGWIDSGSGNYTFQSTGSTSGTAGAAATALAERMRIDSSGNVGIGGTALAYDKVLIGGTLPTSGSFSLGYVLRATIPSGTTSTFIGFDSAPVTQAASFTLTNLYHFLAEPQAKGAGSTITNQYGFAVASSLTDATNNYGFYSDIASGSNRWNFYAAGTAVNYFAGEIRNGRTTNLYGETLSVAGFAVIGANSGGTGQVIIGNDGTTGINGTVDNVAYVFRTNNTERMRITSGGNVGIGVDPGAANIRLYVKGANQTAGQYTIAAQDGSGNNLFLVENNGNLTALPTYSVTVGGTNRDLYIDNAGLIGYVSSIRASKTNIQNLADVSWLKSLTPVSYQYRKKDADGSYTSEADGGIDYGLIAEDVEAVAPELCFYDTVDGNSELRGVTYSKLITPMLKYIQQLESRIAALEAK